MPKIKTKTSTVRRKKLAEDIDREGKIMPRACSNCVRDKKVCKVHVRSGRCNECNRVGFNNCNLRVTKTKWRKLKEERLKLDRELEEVEDVIAKAHAKHARLRKQLKALKGRADDAIAVTESSIVAQEEEERISSSIGSGTLSMGIELALKPSTWSA